MTDQSSQSSDFKWILCLAVVVRIFAVFFSQGFNHPDELFSVLEPAFGLVHGFSLKSWEWVAGIRSYFLPSLYAPLLFLGKLIHVEHPHSVALLVRAVTALFSLLSVTSVYQIAQVTFKDRRVAQVASLLMALWWTSVYFSVRTLSEPLSLNLVLWGHALLFSAWSLNGEVKRSIRNKSLLAGIVMGLSFCMRFQCGLFCLALALSSLIKGKKLALSFFCLGVLIIVFLIQGPLDYLTWGKFLSSPIQYAWWNVVEGGAIRVFGKNPWHRYLTALIRFFTLPGALMVLFFCGKSLFSKKTMLQVWPLWLSVFVFGGVHQALGHKEDRFIIPLLPFFFLLSAQGLFLWREKIQPAKVQLATSLLLIILVGGQFYKLCKIQWNLHRDVTDAFVEAYEAQKVTGLLVYGTTLSHSGGYFYFAKNVPIHFATDFHPHNLPFPLIPQPYNTILPFSDPSPLLKKLLAKGVSCEKKGQRLWQCKHSGPNGPKLGALEKSKDGLRKPL